MGTFEKSTSIFKDQLATLSVYRSLSPLAQVFCSRLVLSSTPISAIGLTVWLAVDDPSASVRQILEELQFSGIIEFDLKNPELNQEIRVNPDFQERLRGILLNGVPKTEIPESPPEKTPSVKSLEKHSSKVWSNMLAFMAQGGCAQSRTVFALPTKTPPKVSKHLEDLLRNSALLLGEITKLNEKNKSKKKKMETAAFAFILKSRLEQIRLLVVNAMANESDAQKHNDYRFISRFDDCRVGEAFLTKEWSSLCPKLFDILCETGIIYSDASLYGKYFFATPSALLIFGNEAIVEKTRSTINTTACMKQTRIELATPTVQVQEKNWNYTIVSNSTRTECLHGIASNGKWHHAEGILQWIYSPCFWASQEALNKDDKQHTLMNAEHGISDSCHVIVCSNFRMYAYTSSPLYMELIRTFARIECLLPGMVCGLITADTIAKAQAIGINAKEIVSFVTTHVHTKAVQKNGRKGICPHVCLQIHLWGCGDDEIEI